MISVVTIKQQKKTTIKKNSASTNRLLKIHQKHFFITDRQKDFLLH